MATPAGALLPRLLTPYLARAARVMPVVVLTGARQTGKSTLARMFDGDDRLYLTLETPAVLGRAHTDPEAFVTQARTMVLDEVQRDAELLLAIKTAVDTDVPRAPGRFLLTGSANLLLMKQVRESLAGRAAYLTLHPMTRREQLGLGDAGIWSALLETPPRQWRDLVLAQVAPFEDWRDVARRGGYPPAAVEIADQEDRWLWFDGYLRTYLQRDVPEISAIDNIPDFDTILRSIAMRVGTFVNQTQLARESSVPQSTVHRYVNVLETSYQLYRLPGYAVNRTKQLVKSPKYYWSDSGFALALSREREPRGQHFENVIVQDLLAWRDSRVAPPELFYWRTSKGYEVDFVIDDGHALLPIEVKTTTQPSTKDLAGMKVFLEEYADRAAAGVLLYAGEQAFWIAKNVLAAPWWMVV
ncbi:MAG TPA: ATP-binding protein [Gemmatimonadaceae bacterium]|nr:ATP-binding protein [Gemmatimonadaceae bacterium]